jgi:uncharacterized membrane protein
MHKNFLIFGLLLLSLLGIADSTYLSYEALTGGALSCTIKGLEGCNVVAQSVYSHLFGIPLGVYGVVFYAAMFILTILVLMVPIRFAHDALAGLGISGLIASLFFIGIQEFLIKALCVYCLASAAISFCACILSVLLWHRFTAPKKSVNTALNGDIVAAS